MNRLKLGIEKTIVGFFFILAFLFFLMAIKRYNFENLREVLLPNGYDPKQLSSLLDFYKGLLPYIATGLVAFSYLVGSVIDSLSYSLIYRYGPKYKRWIEDETGKEKRMIIIIKKVFKKLLNPSGFGGIVDLREYAIFMSMAPSVHIDEYDSFRGRNTLFRVLALAAIANLFSVLIWLLAIRANVLSRILWPSIILISGIVFWTAYKANRSEFSEFREHTFRIYFKRSTSKKAVDKASWSGPDASEKGSSVR